LCADYSNKNAPMAVIKIHFTLFKLNGGGSTNIVIDKYYSVCEQLDDKDNESFSKSLEQRFI